jgi:hypothetical protein
MDKQAATQLIGDTFNYPFDEGRFRNFALNLLNNVDETKGFDYLSGTYIRHSFKDHITKYRRLGTYTDPTGETIDVLVVELKNEWALERSRTMLRNFTSDYLKNRDEKDAALVAYYTSNPEDWRFSYIRMEYKRVQDESGKFKIKEDITPAKRYSFLVGKNEPNHTAQAQLVGMLSDDRNNPTLTELETAFSVDAVTKQFYKDYRDQFEKLWNELNDIVDKDPKISEEFENQTIDTANFAKKLMGQIVFLYFLQKKGWLGVGKDSDGNFKDWGTGPKNFLRRLYDKEFTDYGNFFNDVLEPLFYEALATERTSDVFTQFNCKIPFLNGGLFEPINDYNWEETDIRIDNDIIVGVFDIFDQYNFTVREDEPLEKEVAVDPEMLGKVFENLLPENLRKGKGAFYTPRNIVHYMCQESLINYLDTECESVPREDIETLIREGDIILELETAIVEKEKKYKSALMDSIKENAQALDDNLANIKVCDPAIGSGAFPVGMMAEIIKSRKVLELYLDKKLGVYELKRHCIQNSLYGVDIDPGAIEIAKLRLWLSLVVDEDDYTTIQPLPNLDYKIMQGNSLIEEFHGISLNIEKKSLQKDLFSGGSDLDTLIDDLHQKQDEFFNAEHPREKNQKRESVETAIYDIFHNELEKKKSISPQESKEIETDLKEMTHGNKERNFFPWKLYFADVFREKGGFDVVIGNPPYISFYSRMSHKEKYADIINYLRNNYNFTNKKISGRLNTVMFFLEKAIYLSNSTSLIIDANFFENAFYNIRKYLIKHCNIDYIINKFSAFETVHSDQIIIAFSKHNGNVVEKFRFISNLFKNESTTELFSREQLVSDWNITISSSNYLSDLNDRFIKDSSIFDLNELYETVTGVQIGIGGDRSFGGKQISELFYHHDKLSENHFPNVEYKLDKFFRYCPLQFKNYLHFDVELGHQINKLPKCNIALPKYKNFISNEKILIRQSSAVLVATYTDVSCIGEYSLFSIKSKGSSISLKYLLGLLNSNFLTWYALESGIIRTGEKKQPQIRIKGINKIPIVKPHSNRKDSIIKLVNQILTAKKSNPQADTTALEAEIDQLVYELYGLTEEEIAIVEESVG